MRALRNAVDDEEKRNEKEAKRNERKKRNVIRFYGALICIRNELESSPAKRHVARRFGSEPIKSHRSTSNVEIQSFDVSVDGPSSGNSKKGPTNIGSAVGPCYLVFFYRVVVCYWGRLSSGPGHGVPGSAGRRFAALGQSLARPALRQRPLQERAHPGQHPLRQGRTFTEFFFSVSNLHFDS